MSDVHAKPSETHQTLEEGNRAPKEVQRIIEEYMAREPSPARGRRIALGETVLREVDGKAHLRWKQLLRSHWWPGPTYNGKGQYTVQARNLVLKQAFDDLHSWDDLLFWDADQVPPLIVPALPDIGWMGGFFTDYIDWLSLSQTDKPVIAGLYFSREDYWQLNEMGQVKAGPHEPLGYTANSDGSYRFLREPEIIPMLQKRGMYRVAGAGTGSMLIRKEVLLALAEKKHPRAIFEAPMLEPGAPGGGPGSQWTEDLYFCHEVKKELGGQIWLDTAMESAHVAEMWITSAHYLDARGYQTAPHEDSLRGQMRQPVNQSRENERRRSKIILPR